MVIWPVSALRCAAKAQEELYETLRRDGSARSMIDRVMFPGDGPSASRS
jgi:methylisocitrate lyase